MKSRHRVLRIGLCYAVLASLLQQDSRGADRDEPNRPNLTDGRVILGDRILAVIVGTYDPSVPEVSAWDASVVNCGTAETECDSGCFSEQGTKASSGDSRFALHNVDSGLNREIVTIDVMVLYTAEAQLLRGQAEVENTIQLSIACANETLRRSQVPVELHLVHVAEARGYRESGKLGTAIGWLASDPMVDSLRNEYGADLVSLMVSRGDFSGLAACGRSHSVFTGHPVTFTHEMGHNFGCGHERGQPGQCSRDTFSHAHVFTPPDGSDHAYGTIMSYVGSLILNFSNPGVRFRGHLTGLPEGHHDNSGRADSADNARTIATTAPEVAARRASRVPSFKSPRVDDAGKTFSFEIVGSGREHLVLEYTSDFMHWLSLGSFETGSGATRIFDAVESVGARFYRTRGGTIGQGRVIGFYRRSVPAGYSLIANQLDLGDNRVERLFANLPLGTTLYKWDASSRGFIENALESSGWTKPDMTLHPGEGALIHTEIPLMLSFVGHVRDACYLPMSTEWSIISSPMPQSGGVASTLKFPLGGRGQTGEISKYTGSQPGYQSWRYADGSWLSEGEPHVEIGEAFWARSSPNAYVWKHILIPLKGPDIPNANQSVLKVTRSQSSTVELTIKDHPGVVCQIEGSADLTHWRVLAILRLVAGDASWTDPEANSRPFMFYRATRLRP